MTLQIAIDDAKQNKAQNLFENNICLVLSFSAWGINRKADISKIETDADKESLKLQKKLIKSKAYDRIMSHRSEIKAFLQRFSVPSSAFRPAAHLIRLENVAFVDERLQAYINAEEALLDAFCVEYNDAVLAAQENLQSQYRASQYPPVDQVRKEFTIRIQYMTFGVPETLKKIQSSLFRRESERIEKTISEVTSNIEALLIGEFESLVDKALENLRPDSAAGKKKMFRTEWIEKINELVESLRARNLTENPDLYALGEKVKLVMADADAEELKRFKSGRTFLAEKFDELKATMATMIVAKPNREYFLDESK